MSYRYEYWYVDVSGRATGAAHRKFYTSYEDAERDNPNTTIKSSVRYGREEYFLVKYYGPIVPDNYYSENTKILERVNYKDRRGYHFSIIANVFAANAFMWLEDNNIDFKFYRKGRTGLDGQRRIRAIIGNRMRIGLKTEEDAMLLYLAII